MRSRVASDSGLSSGSNETCDGDRSGKKSVESSLSVHEKIRYLKWEMSNIRVAKRLFTERCMALQRTVDFMTWKIIARAEAKKQSMKASLSEMENAKIQEWSRQMKVCEDAEEDLNCHNDSSLASLEALQETCNAYARRLGFIDSGNIEVQRDVTAVLRELELFGELHFEVDTAKKRVSKIMEPKFVIGGTGENVKEFDRPWGVCSDPAGRIIVADRGKNKIQVFDQRGNFLLQFGNPGSGPGEFDRPAGVAVDRKCRIIVSDKDNHRVQVFNFSGSFIFAFGGKGIKPGLFQYPWGVAVDSKNNIAVSDTRNRRIQLFDYHGVFVTMFDFNEGIRGMIRAVSPRGVVFKRDGSLLTTDFNNHCILVISKDFTEGRKWKGGEDRTLFRPQGIACDGHGGIAVVDSRNDLVQVFDHAGNLIKSFGQKGSNPGEFDCPQDVCFQPNGNIVVTEFGNNRLQVF